MKRNPTQTARTSFIKGYASVHHVDFILSFSWTLASLMGVRALSDIVIDDCLTC